MGELAALSASAFWAVASLMFTRLSAQYGPMVMNLLKCALALAMMVVTLAVLEGALWPADVSASDTWILVASGLVGLTIGDTAYFTALTRIGPRRTLLMTALVPPVTALLAWPVLGEAVTVGMAGGMLLTIAGIAWVIRERVPPAEGAEELAASDLAVGLAFALVSVACQSSGNVLTKLGGADASAIGISVVRVLAGSVGLAVVVAARGQMGAAGAPLRERSATGRLLVATFLGTYLGIWMLNAGLKYTSHTGIAATLSSTAPLFILPLAWLVLGERLTMRSVLGAVVAVAGVAILFAV